MIVATDPRGWRLVRTLLVACLLMAPALRAWGDEPVVAPAPVGARPELADVTIWSVDDKRVIPRWKDGEWTGHARLLRLLQAAGLRPRVEHMAREDFGDRWEEAVGLGHLPELVTVDRFNGLFLDLEAKGRLVGVRSERLTFMTEVASCADFAGRWLSLVVGSPHEAEGRRAVDELLKPGPETPLPGPEISQTAGQAEAVAVARRAVIAYVSGDPERLRRLASSTSPQLSRCTSPPEYRRSWDVEAGSVEVRSNEAIAFARVEMRFRGKSMIGGDPVLVVLRREGSHWKAFSVGNDIWCVRSLPELCRLALRPRADMPAVPPAPQLLHPEDDKKLTATLRSFAWEVPAGGAPLAAQVGEVLLDEKGSSWPMSRIKVYPGEPRERSLPVAEPALTGVTSDQMRWCVWAIATDGGLSVSEVRRYRNR
jgi:hypothetical protein